MTGALTRVALFSLFAASKFHSIQTWAAIDEFQRAVGGRLDLIFQQAREKVGLILSNQCLADLRTRDKDYRPTVKTCCRLQWTFNAADEDEQSFMSEHSGKVIRKLISNTYDMSITPIISTRTYQEYLDNRYDLAMVSRTNATPELSLFRCTQDEGFIQMGGLQQIVLTEFHISKSEYQRRRLMPWPKATPETITPELPQLLGEPAPPAPKAPNIVNPDSRRNRRNRNHPR